MDLRQLAALTAVADHRSFSAAARALHTVQSNVSTHVARLERELGATLVDRTTGELTNAGELVVGRARRIQTELEALTADVT
ncbi:MAG: LysR family transcriptional regulator, partial [Aquihabitans sp.]